MRSGDILALAPGPAAKPTVFQRAIRLTGSFSTHNETLIDNFGELVCGNAHVPRYTLDPLADRVAEFKAGLLVFAIFRIAGPLPPGYAESARGAARILRGVAYDKAAIVNHGRNWLRSQMRRAGIRLPLVTGHREYQVYCTESVFAVSRAAGVDLASFSGLGRQPLPAPVHIERLYALGHLELVEDFGLVDNITRP